MVWYRFEWYDLPREQRAKMRNEPKHTPYTNPGPTPSQRFIGACVSRVMIGRWGFGAIVYTSLTNQYSTEQNSTVFTRTML